MCTELSLEAIHDPLQIERFATWIASEDGTEAIRSPFADLGGQQHCLVVKGGDGVGFVSLAPGPTSLHLARLLVLPEHRRKGLAGKVFRLLAGRASQLTGQVMASNHTAIGCYRKHGWSFVELILRKEDLLHSLAPDDPSLETWRRRGWLPCCFEIEYRSNSTAPAQDGGL